MVILFLAFVTANVFVLYQNNDFKFEIERLLKTDNETQAQKLQNMNTKIDEFINEYWEGNENNLREYVDIIGEAGFEPLDLSLIEPELSFDPSLYDNPINVYEIPEEPEPICIRWDWFFENYECVEWSN